MLTTAALGLRIQASLKNTKICDITKGVTCKKKFKKGKEQQKFL
jgi:hypothetical protein